MSGGSADMNFTFEAKGGDSWCQRAVAVDVKFEGLSNPDANPYGFEKRLKRVLQVARDQCPAMQGLEIHGQPANGQEYSVEFLRMGDWNLVRKTGDDPQCLPTVPQTRCSDVILAYNLLKKFLSDPFFDGVQLTDYLVGDEESDAQWNGGAVVGKVSRIPADEMALVAGDRAQFANTVIRVIADKCAADGNVVEANERQSKPEAEYRSLVCRGKALPEAQNIIIYQSNVTAVLRPRL